MNPRIAIIGAGISGLTLASQLVPHADVQVFEKARGVGGRMSTRYAGPFLFDHGTQFFTARSKPFQRFIAPLITDGVIAPWKGKVITIEEGRKISDRLWFEPHYVAVPNMNSLCKHMAAHLHVATGTEVAPLVARSHDGWQLRDKDGITLGKYDWVISTAPLAQTQRLFASCLQAENPLPEAGLLGCYALMLGFNQPWNQLWIAAKVHASPIEWIAVNSTKPGRDKATTSIVVHTSNAWAEEHIDDDMDEAKDFLRKEFESISGIEATKADYLSLHRWRYAITNKPRELKPFVDKEFGIASTGDWYTASRIEDAWLNAIKLADAVLTPAHHQQT